MRTRGQKRSQWLSESVCRHSWSLTHMVMRECVSVRDLHSESVAKWQEQSPRPPPWQQLTVPCPSGTPDLTARSQNRRKRKHNLTCSWVTTIVSSCKGDGLERNPRAKVLIHLQGLLMLDPATHKGLFGVCSPALTAWHPPPRHPCVLVSSHMSEPTLSRCHSERASERGSEQEEGSLPSKGRWQNLYEAFRSAGRTAPNWQVHEGHWK